MFILRWSAVIWMLSSVISVTGPHQRSLLILLEIVCWASGHGNMAQGGRFLPILLQISVRNEGGGGRGGGLKPPP